MFSKCASILLSKAAENESVIMNCSYKMKNKANISSVAIWFYPICRSKQII